VNILFYLQDVNKIIYSQYILVNILFYLQDVNKIIYSQVVVDSLFYPYNTYHCVTIVYSIQYSNMPYRFVA